MEVSLRLEINETDATKMIRWLANQNITKYLNEDIHTGTSLQMIIDEKRSDLLTYYLNQDGRFFLIDTSLHGCIGFVNLFTIRAKKEYEVVIAIGEQKHWGKQYAKEALKQIMREVFIEWRIEKLNAKIHMENLRSRHLFEHLDFTHTQLKRDYHYFSMTSTQYVAMLKMKRMTLIKQIAADIQKTLQA